MADVLCLDTEQDTVSSLIAAGNHVVSASFGYANGYRSLEDAPQDFDLVVCDLRVPARFDMYRWGPFDGNDNYRCTIIPQSELTWERRLVLRNPSATPQEELRYRLIYETQIERMNYPSRFGPKDVRNAITLGGIPAIIFLNPDWVLRTGGYSFPEFVGMLWQTSATNALKIDIKLPLAKVVKDWQPPLDINIPASCSILKGPRVPGRIAEETWPSETLVSDKIGSVLGQVVRSGAGSVWLIPATKNNASAACQFAANVEALLAVSGSLNVVRQDDVSSREWDVFISHASEDKSYTDMLYQALVAAGVSVWYDKFVLRMGDSLRKKIDEGLANSRFGVVVLSHAFFSNDWPQAELDALVNLQMADGAKRILPIWLDLNDADVRKYSPLLAGLMASKSTVGIGKNVTDILSAIGLSG
jgi:hypothetical protein